MSTITNLNTVRKPKIKDATFLWEDKMKNLGEALFKYRSYVPLPFVLVMILFINPTSVSIIAGLAVAICGELIRLWAVSYTGSETRTTCGVGGTVLVTQGPYAIIRNPLYAGNIFIYTGFAIMSNSIFPFLPVIGFLYFTFQYYCIIKCEEEYLRNTFDEKYEIYTSKVKRYIPFPSKLPPDVRSNLCFKLKTGLASEKRSLQAFLIILVLILFFYITGVRIL